MKWLEPSAKPLPLPKHGTLPAGVHVFDPDSVLAVNAALAAGRPLLVRGEPGTGKSQLARAAAAGLGRAFLSKTVDVRTEAQDLLWSFDAVKRLAQAQLEAALRSADAKGLDERLHERKFVAPGPLWWAFDWPSARAQAELVGAFEPPFPDGWQPGDGCVVLLDELDKADSAVPNGLLETLGSGRFPVPGREPVALTSGPAPLVVITTNEERALPDAFLRRCLVLHLELPGGTLDTSGEREALVAWLMARGEVHFDRCPDKVRRRAAELLVEDRVKVLARGLAAPGQAEYLDLLRAVTEQAQGAAAQVALLESIAGFALRKHPRDPHDSPEAAE